MLIMHRQWERRCVTEGRPMAFLEAENIHIYMPYFKHINPITRDHISPY